MIAPPTEKITWRIEVPITWMGKGWLSLAAYDGFGEANPREFFWDATNLPLLVRDDNRVWRSLPPAQQALAGVIVETADDIDGLNQALADGYGPLQIWVGPSSFRLLDRVERPERISAIATRLISSVVDLSPLVRFSGLRALSLNQAAMPDLSPLDELKNLEVLTIDACDSILDLSVIGRMSALRSLELRRGDLPDLSSVGGLGKIESLWLPETIDNVTFDLLIARCARLRSLTCHSSRLHDVSEIGRLTSLESLELKLSECNDFSPLGGLSRLRRLALWNIAGLNSLAPIVEMPELTAIDVSGCDALRDFAPIMHVPGLTELALPKSITRDQLAAIAAACPRLKKLRLPAQGVALDAAVLSSLTELRDLHAHVPLTNSQHLPKLRNLESLHVMLAEEARDVGFLHGLTKLRRLSIAAVTGLSDTSALAQLPALESLQIYYCAPDLAPVARLNSLSECALCYCGHPSGSDSLSDLPRLSAVVLSSTRIGTLWNVRAGSALTALNLSDSDVEDLTPLKSASRLRELSLYSCERLRDVNVLGKLPNLRHLNLSYCQSVRRFTGLADAPRLASLDLGGNQWITDLRLVSRIKTLTKLSLAWNEQLTDLRPLAQLQSLEDLDLIGCTGLTDLTPLTKLPELRVLSVSGCEGVADFSPLGRCRRLVYLLIEGTFVQDISFIRQLPDLRYIDLSMSGASEVSDLTPLVGLRAKGCVVQIAERFEELEALDAEAGFAPRRAKNRQ